MAKRRKRREDSFFGLHFDLHPNEQDTRLGADVTEEMIERLLRRVRPDYVQYDCKGHPGYTGYPTKVGWPSPGVKKDALKVWRRVTRRHGVALYVHYSGVWDSVAVQHHPEWACVDKNGHHDQDNTSTFGPYVDELLIPQLKEVAQAYDLDGVWVDGDCWAVRPDYSQAAIEAWREATGRDSVPVGPSDPYWTEFLEFHREQFRHYVRRYVDALHAFKPGLQVCSNWMFSTRMPEPVTAPVDFLSGDFSPSDSVNTARLEARYFASTGMPWDLMAWGFNKGTETAWMHKTAAQLEQEAAVVLSQGGGFQIYYGPTRAGWLDDWLTAIMAEVVGFCRTRRAASFRTESVPQVALLLSTESLRDKRDAPFTWAGDPLRAVEGALHALLELGYSVDVLAEHQLRDRLSEYPLVVLPECDVLAPGFDRAMTDYVAAGGRLLAMGPSAARLVRRQLGVRLRRGPGDAGAYVEAGGVLCWAGGPWQRVSLLAARPVAQRYPTIDLRTGAETAATIAQCGKGKIGAVYGPVASVFRNCHHPVLREFLRGVVADLFPDPMVRLQAPPCVDLALRRKGRKLLVHLANTAGMQTATRHTGVDFIPPVGPIRLKVHLPDKPRSVRLVGQKGGLTSRWENGRLDIQLERLDIHAVVAIG